MTYVQYFWGVLVGVLIVLSVFALIFMAQSCVIRAWRSIHRNNN